TGVRRVLFRSFFFFVPFRANYQDNDHSGRHDKPNSYKPLNPDLVPLNPVNCLINSFHKYFFLKVLNFFRKSYEIFSVLLYPGNVWGRIGNVKMYLLPGLTVKQSHVFTRTFRQKTLTRTGEMKSTRYHPKTKNGQF